MIRKVFALLSALALVLGFSVAASGSVQASPAPYSEQIIPLNATNGFHNHTFYSCTVDNRRARMYIRYEITSGATQFRLAEVLYETDWNTHPAFNANAVRLDLEFDALAAPDTYTEVSPAWGGSSTTLDDMPTYHNQLYVGNPTTFFFNSGNPNLRARFYGVGAGSVGGRCDDFAPVE